MENEQKTSTFCRDLIVSVPSHYRVDRVRSGELLHQEPIFDVCCSMSPEASHSTSSTYQ